MRAPERTPLGAALALLLALVTLTGSASPALMVGAVSLTAILLGIGWPALLELPSPGGTRWVVSCTGVLAAVTILLAPERIEPISGILMVCALGIFGAFVHQMARPQREELTFSLTGTVSGALMAGLGASWVLAQHLALAQDQTALLTAIALGLVATLLLSTAPVPTLVQFLLSAVVGAALTAMLLMQLLGLELLLASGIGAVSAIAAAAAQQLLGSTLVAREAVPSLAVAAAPVATVGVVALLVVSQLP